MNLGLPNDRWFLLGFVDDFGAVRDAFEAEKLLLPLSEGGSDCFRLGSYAKDVWSSGENEEKFGRWEYCREGVGECC